MTLRLSRRCQRSLFITLIVIVSVSDFAFRTAAQGTFAQPVLLEVTHRTEWDSSYLIAHESIEWRTHGPGEVAIRLRQSEDNSVWAILDFNSFQLGDPVVQDLETSASAFVGRIEPIRREERLLRLLLADDQVRVVLDPHNSSRALILRPQLYPAAWDRALSLRRWNKALALLNEAESFAGQSGFPSPQEIQAKRHECLLLRGHQSLKEGNHFQAASDLSAIPQHSDPSFRLALAEALYRSSGRSNLERAEGIFLELQDSQKHKGEASFFLGRLYLGRKEQDRAIAELSKSLQSETLRAATRAEALLLLGLAYFDRSSGAEGDSAIEDRRKSISYLQRSLDLNQAGHDSRARRLLGRIREVTPAATDEGASEPALEPSRAASKGLDAVPGNVRLRVPIQDIKAMRGRIVLVHFWASWCKPCLEELPSLDQFYAQAFPALVRHGLELITVSNDFREVDVIKYVRKSGFRPPVYFDPDAKLQQRFGISTTLPQTLVVGRDGRKLDSLLGHVNWQDKEILEGIKRYFAQ